MRILVTGALGFTGKYLTKSLQANSANSLYLTDRKHSITDNNYYHCDLAQPQECVNLLQQSLPNQIFHLAGAFTNNYRLDYSSNVESTTNLLESISNMRSNCRILLVGSAAEYGFTSQIENPIEETCALRPANIYGLTKVYQTYLMGYYHEVHNINIVMARPFNLYGKGMSDRLFVGTVYKQIELLRRGVIDVITVGNVDNERDYIEIDDAIKHYITIMTNGKSGEIYNVGCGIPIKTKSLLKRILAQENIDSSLVRYEKPTSIQDYDATKVTANITKLSLLR